MRWDAENAFRFVDGWTRNDRICLIVFENSGLNGGEACTVKNVMVRGAVGGSEWFASVGWERSGWVVFG
jgi:hypothetical protein